MWQRSSVPRVPLLSSLWLELLLDSPVSYHSPYAHSRLQSTQTLVSVHDEPTTCPWGDPTSSPAPGDPGSRRSVDRSSCIIKVDVNMRYSQTCVSRKKASEHVPMRKYKDGEASLHQWASGIQLRGSRRDGLASGKESAASVSSHHCTATAGPLWLICPAAVIYSFVRDQGWTPQRLFTRRAYKGEEGRLGKYLNTFFFVCFLPSSLSSFATIFPLH